MPHYFKEHRCKYCNKLFFKGDLLHCTIEIKCNKCKKINVIEGINCQFIFPTQKSGHDEKSGQVSPAKQPAAKDILIRCSECREADRCGHHKAMKKHNACPLCSGW